MNIAFLLKNLRINGSSRWDIVILNYVRFQGAVVRLTYATVFLVFWTVTPPVTGQESMFRSYGPVVESGLFSGSSRRTMQMQPRESTGHVDVPEPLLFDLVRPLGARKGELEINTLALFPWSQSNTNLEDDPFGPGPTTPDRKGIEWAPELEYAIADNFAIEFEFPFEEAVLEEYKLGLQWTIGTAFDERYIHGFQMLIEPDVYWRKWNTTLLYLGGIRFDERWSALFMLGGRIDLEGPNNSETLERIVNGSLFADLTAETKVGIETNFAAQLDGTSSLIVVPQMHNDLTDCLQLQWGLGFGAFSEGSEESFIMRLIYNL
jgi:hypothetical protein